MNNTSLWSAKRTAAYGLFLLASALYIWGLAPTIYWRDSAEFIAAVHVLGTTHPAGSPTYTLLAKLLTFLPIGSIALRLNLFSALCGAFAVSLLFSVLYDLLAESPRRVRLCAALSGALFLLVSESFWRFSEVAEVYTLQNSILVGLLALLLKARTARTWDQPRHLTFYWLFAFLYGLSAGVHATMAFFVPGFLIFITLTEPRILRGKGLAFLVFFFLLGFAIYLYLPIRSLSEPALDWGDTETFRQLLIHMTDRKDAPVHFELPLPKLPFQIRVYLSNLSNEFSTLGLVLGVIGCISLWYRDKPIWLTLLFIYLSNVGFFVRSWTAAFGFLPSFVIFSLWIGFGVHVCLTCLATLYQRHRIRVPRIAAYVCVLGGVVLTLGQSFSRHLGVANQAGNYSAELYGKQLLEQLPANAILFSDHSWFILLYMQQVERWRPDFTLLLQSEIFIPSQFAFLSKERFPNIEMVTSDQLIRISTVEYFWRLSKLNQEDHALFWEADRQFQKMFDNYLCPEGWLFAFTPGKEATITPEILRAHEDLLMDSVQRILHGIRDNETYDFFATRMNYIGLYFRRRGLDDEAAKMYRAGLRIQPERFDLRNNYGNLLLAHNQFPQAFEQLNVAYDLQPTEPVINENLGLLMLGVGNATQAVHFLEQALYLNPNSSRAYELLGVAYLQLGHFSRSVHMLQTALTLFDEASATRTKRQLGHIYAQLGEAHIKLGRFAEAAAALQAALTRFEESAGHVGTDEHLATMITWIRENLYYLEQGQINQLIPHPLFSSATPLPT
jgi:tetratricopeptide (TPR) repeat protein